jgi:hypothetical protein
VIGIRGSVESTRVCQVKIVLQKLKSGCQGHEYFSKSANE